MTLPKTRELTEEQLEMFYRIMNTYTINKRLADMAYKRAMDYLGECLVKNRAEQMEYEQRN